MIHLPLPGTGTTWRLFFGVDVLQCLAVTLLAVIAVEKWWPRRSGIALVLLAAVMVGWGALPAERAGLGTGFWPLEAWFDQSGLSLFPLVPWAGFVVAGVLMARWRVPLWGWPVLGLLLLALPSPPFISKSGMAVASGFGVSLCGSECAGPSLAVVDGAGIAGAVCRPSFAALFCAHGPLDRTGSGSVADGAGGAGTDGVFDGASLGVAARVEPQARRGGSADW